MARKSLITERGERFDFGYVSRDFATTADKMRADLEDAYILLHEKVLPGEVALIPILEAVIQAGKPLLIVAAKIEGNALALLRVNKERGALKVAAAEAPEIGDRRNPTLAKIATVTGGQVFGDVHGRWVEHATLDMLGRAKKLVITEEEITIIGGAGELNGVELLASESELGAPPTLTEAQEVAAARLAATAPSPDEAMMQNKIMNALAAVRSRWPDPKKRPPAAAMAAELLRTRKVSDYKQGTLRQIILGTYRPMKRRGIKKP